MKRLVYCFWILCFIPIVGLSDQSATTNDGRKVVLRDDGTWVYDEPIPTSFSAASDEYADADRVIATKCKEEWPDDFRMRAHCQKRQSEAIDKLKEGKPHDITKQEYEVAHKKCMSEWPQDFAMRSHCEKRQFEGIRDIRR